MLSMRGWLFDCFTNHSLGGVEHHRRRDGGRERHIIATLGSHGREGPDSALVEGRADRLCGVRVELPEEGLEDNKEGRGRILVVT